jgi:hypothetical protein
MRAAGVVTVVAVLLLGACSSSSKPKPAPPTTTTAGPSTTTTTASPTTTSAPVSTTTAPVQSASSEAVARAFFAAWVAHNASALTALGQPAAVTKAKAAWSKTTTGFVFSNCSGAAGSLYCTWVRRGESVVVRVDNITVPHKVSDFTRTTLDAQGVAEQYLAAWQAGSFAALPVLGDIATAGKATNAAAQSTRPWSFANCSGAAGSLYCTWNAGSAKLVIRVQDVNPPPSVIDFTYTP